MGPGPTAERSYLYVGDIGDNGRTRSSIDVYRVAEPTVTGPGNATLDPDRLRLRYPDGAHNAETLLVDTDGAIYVLTKQSGSATIFRAPPGLVDGSTTTLTEVGHDHAPVGRAPHRRGHRPGGRCHPAPDLRRHHHVPACARHPAGRRPHRPPLRGSGRRRAPGRGHHLHRRRHRVPDPERGHEPADPRLLEALTARGPDLVDGVGALADQARG